MLFLWVGENAYSPSPTPIFRSRLEEEVDLFLFIHPYIGKTAYNTEMLIAALTLAC